MAWIDDPMSVLSDEGLKQAIRGAPSEQARAELKRALAWSERVNWAISEIVRGIPPFSGARMFLQDMRNTADVVVVSATPVETLRREWSEHGIAQFAALICGQESGSKRLQIQLAGNHYPKNHVIMVGDAPGDLEAARANDALFYPIVPGHEGACWEQLRAEGIDRFCSGMYAGQYETQLVARLTDALPAVPPWEKEK
jgi:phosphoglycolate phosphatase-like HAD superfamily hydrolase